jgi:uncharacterized protein
VWQIPVGSEATRALHELADGTRRGVYVMAHGAGGNMQDRAMAAASTALRGIGLDVVRFNFLYKEKGSGSPDRMPKLIDCFTAVTDRVRTELPNVPLYIGGRSMGGRAASMMAADGFDATGLILLAYPLHPPGQHDKLRDEHLPSITMPVLCCNGTRDTFCDPALMAAAVKKVNTRWTMHWIEGADHGFHVPKKSGRTDADVLHEVANATAEWLKAVVTSTRD